MKHQECLLLTKSLKGFFPPVLYSYSLGGKDFLLELIKQRELNSLRVVFMSEKVQGLQPYQMQEKWEQIQLTGEIKIESQLFPTGYYGQSISPFGCR